MYIDCNVCDYFNKIKNKKMFSNAPIDHQRAMHTHQTGQPWGGWLGGGGSNQLISSISPGVIAADGSSEQFVYFVDTSLCRLQFQEEKACSC